MAISRILIASVWLLMAASSTYATPQILDRLWFEDKKYPVPQLPLEGLLPDETDFDPMSTANWKGYIAEWEIEDSRLYLTKFQAKRDRKRVPISEFLPDAELPLLATWFTGQIHLPLGEQRGTDAYTSVIVFHISKGRVTKAEVLFGRTLRYSWNGLPEEEPKADTEAKAE